MKIVDRKTFLELPKNILFSKFEPCLFGELLIKGETWGNDFWCQQIKDAIDCNDSGEFADILFDAIENETHFNMDFECESRDGLFEDGQLFAVWETDDINQLIGRLKKLVAI